MDSVPLKFKSIHQDFMKGPLSVTTLVIGMYRMLLISVNYSPPFSLLAEGNTAYMSV